MPGGEGQEEAEPGEEAPEEDLGRDAHGEEQGQGQARARQEEAAVDPAAGPVLPVAEVEVGPHRRHGGHGPEEVGPAQVGVPGEEDRRARQHRHQDGEKGGGPVLALILPGHGDGALEELRHVPVREGLGGLVPAGAHQLRHREAQGGGQGLQGVDIREAHARFP